MITCQLLELTETSHATNHSEEETEELSVLEVSMVGTGGLTDFHVPVNRPTHTLEIVDFPHVSRTASLLFTC